MYKGYRVAVVMPINNEEDHLTRAVSRVPDYVDLILAVDDGSTDETWARLCRLKDERLIRLRHEVNLGVGAATKSGYGYALQAGAELIAVMDGDGQMDGRDLWRLLDRAAGGADYVKGNRFLDSGTITRMPVARFIGNTLLSWLTRRVAFFDSSLDAQCGYTVIRRSALERLDLSRLYDRYGFPNEMLFAAARAGLVVCCVPVRTIYGSETSGVNPMTAVPVILYLIARQYVRSRFSLLSATNIFSLVKRETGIVD